jgi:opacity protein-like surface antigen
MNRKCLFAFIGFTFCMHAMGQVFSNLEIDPVDSLARAKAQKKDYPYSLPILGKKVTAAGYDLPLSAGVSVQYFTQTSDIILENLKVGFNGGEVNDLSGLVKFDLAKARASALTVRPDVWLFPFLNVYGILGMAQASTEVKYRVEAPGDINNNVPIFSGGSLVEFQTTTFGFGVMPAIGVKGAFFILDMNIAWTDVPQLSRPTRTFVIGPRIGKNFKLKKPEQTIAIWVGGFRVSLDAASEGSLPISEALDVEDWGNRIDVAANKVAGGQVKVDTWWSSLSPIEQRNPLNIARYNAANRALTAAGNLVAAADNAVNTASNSTVEYSLDRRPKDPWNFLTGVQYQMNKHWMLRAEAGYLSSRTQFTCGLQYRFGL